MTTEELYAAALAEIKKMHNCAPLLEPPADEIVRGLLKALKAELEHHWQYAWTYPDYHAAAIRRIAAALGVE